MIDHNDIISIVIDQRKSGGVGAGHSDADAERASLAGIDIELTDEFATLGQFDNFAGLRRVAVEILLTHGTSHALELVTRHLLRPGDAALVDDPGYYNMFGNLRLQGVQMLAVPRTPAGPDVNVLESLAVAHRPKVYFTQSVMQNPTGTDMSPHVAFRVLQAAERNNFFVVEDDIFCDLQVAPTPRLATLDQLNRVIYARSFSKTLSGSLRVGFVACAHPLAEQLADLKMLTRRLRNSPSG